MLTEKPKLRLNGIGSKQGIGYEAEVMDFYHLPNKLTALPHIPACGAICAPLAR